MTHNARPGQSWMVGLFVAAFLAGIGYVVWLSVSTSNPDAPGAAAATEGTRVAKPSRTPRPTRTPKATRTPRPGLTPIPTPVPWHVGVVAGHWQNDSGAVCPDGLAEGTINLDVASQAVAILQANGVEAELLPEFAEQLPGYQADAFVSVHTDSCEFPDLSGFKVARVASSAIPAEEDRLVDCLIREYGAATGLAFNEDTITFDMTEYHAFWEIDPSTPGAIIELGFMAADRDLLLGQSERVAQGVAGGILCFLAGR